MNPRHALSSLAAIAGTALLLAGCGGGDDSPAATPAAPASTPDSSAQTPSDASASAVKISNFKFSPASVTAQPGARVTVSNQDTTAHTSTADDGHSFDTGPIDPGSSSSISVSKPGSYPYHCSIHSFMHGTLVVK